MRVFTLELRSVGGIIDFCTLDKLCVLGTSVSVMLERNGQRG